MLSGPGTRRMSSQRNCRRIISGNPRLRIFPANDTVLFRKPVSPSALHSQLRPMTFFFSKVLWCSACWTLSFLKSRHCSSRHASIYHSQSLRHLLVLIHFRRCFDCLICFFAIFSLFHLYGHHIIFLWFRRNLVLIILWMYSQRGEIYPHRAINDNSTKHQRSSQQCRNDR